MSAPAPSCRSRPTTPTDHRHARRDGLRSTPRPRRASTRRARAAAASSPSARPACASSKAPPTTTGRIAPFAGETALFITPGYRFRAVDLLLHQFPPAALDPVHAGRRLRRARAHEARLCACDRRSAIASSPMATPACFIRQRAARERGLRLHAPRARRRGAARPHRDRARHRRDAGLHAGRHGRHRQGDAARGGRGDRRRDRARQHLSPDAAARAPSASRGWAGCTAS